MLLLDGREVVVFLGGGGLEVQYASQILLLFLFHGGGLLPIMLCKMCCILTLLYDALDLQRLKESIVEVVCSLLPTAGVGEDGALEGYVLIQIDGLLSGLQTHPQFVPLITRFGAQVALDDDLDVRRQVTQLEVFVAG